MLPSIGCDDCQRTPCHCAIIAEQRAIIAERTQDAERANQSVNIPDREHISQFFAYEHLPLHLAKVSHPFAVLAEKILELPRNPERTVALRKLLEAKDAAVRAAVAK